MVLSYEFPADDEEENAGNVGGSSPPTMTTRVGGERFGALVGCPVLVMAEKDESVGEDDGVRLIVGDSNCSNSIDGFDGC